MDFPSNARAPITTGAVLVAAKVLSQVTGAHLATTVQIDSTAPTALYYVHMIEGNGANAVPGDGAYGAGLSFLHAPLAVSHVSGTPDLLTIDDGPGGATVTGGLMVVLSTAQGTKVAAPYLLVDGVVS